jgi:hypothetical protein
MYMEGSHPRPRGRPRSSASVVQITERDRTLLAYAAEHRFVLAAQAAVLLDVTEAAAATRLRSLSAAGYLRRERKLHRRPPSFQVTRDGLRAVGSDLAPPRKLDLATYRHDEGLGWLMLAARQGRFGPIRAVISERRMRSHDGRSTEPATRFGVRLGGVGPGGRDRLHYPDMVVVTESGHRVAFELELTTKSPDRRERILAGYAADRRIDAVIYLGERGAVGRAIERSAGRVGISELVHVRNVRLDGAAPASGEDRAAERAPRRGRGGDGRALPPGRDGDGRAGGSVR